MERANANRAAVNIAWLGLDVQAPRGRWVVMSILCARGVDHKEVL
jgi:hypothetical protein